MNQPRTKLREVAGVRGADGEWIVQPKPNLRVVEKEEGEVKLTHEECLLALLEVVSEIPLPCGKLDSTSPDLKLLG